MFSRREFMALSAAAGAGALLSRSHDAAAQTGDGRRFHVCLGSKIIESDPDLLTVVGEAGVTDIWLAAFLYGDWYATPEDLKKTIARIEDAGLYWHLINVPLGHPGDSLGDKTGQTPLTPRDEWRDGVNPDGSRYRGTSLHPPATEQNVAAIEALGALKADTLFLDDDFRLARGPGVIGGCFCDWHRERFLTAGGYGVNRWDELLGDVQGRNLSPLLRSWVDFTCDELTGSVKAQQAAAARSYTDLGNMIMYLGAEKAGIRLGDYRDVPFRVGELMFGDASFAPVKGKTDELFSALFHRRYAQPDLAYSESTAYPADQLSAENMAAKLAVSTIADVRNTMFMSGLTPFPKTHWEVLEPAMMRQARFHERLQGHVPRGPFKHYWGEAARYIGDDKPFSLFLAMGIPFEVVDTVPAEGWAFLCDHDAMHLTAAEVASSAATLYCRAGVTRVPDGVRPMAESLDDLWALKHELIDNGLDVPCVIDDKPVVCAWYPTANAVYLWNLAEQKETVGVEHNGKILSVDLQPLGTALVNL